MLVRLKAVILPYLTKFFSAKNYKYYGVHFANQCFCGNAYGEVLLVDRFTNSNVLRGTFSLTSFFSDCNLSCPGNKSLTCGGSRGISTYGPIPWRPAVAEYAASRTCKPWCPVGFSLNSNQVKLYYSHAAGFVKKDTACVNIFSRSTDFVSSRRHSRGISAATVQLACRESSANFRASKANTVLTARKTASRYLCPKQRIVLDEISSSGVKTMPVAMQCLELAIALRGGPARRALPRALRKNLDVTVTPPADA